ncbi:MAG: DUF4097 family beta strand repeat protein [Myxococcales bacterium]|nr:DUF4097 family beta strand repeat protein [Myxococcales bacterium]MBP6845564.1 DUF4097 family beta strand repeat protein [Kofleriaceae bacterium]
MTARRALAALVSIALAAPAGAWADDGTDGDGDGVVVERAEFQAGVVGRPVGVIAIDNSLGDVRIEGYDGTTVTVIAVKHAPDAASLRRLRVESLANPDGSVRLTTLLTDRGGAERPAVALAAVRVDLTVKVPRAATISGRVTTGRLEVANVDAGADLDSSTGPIVVRNVAGVVFARSLAGSQRFEEVFGSLDSHAVDGDLAFDSVRGAALTARAYAGDIAGRGVASKQVRLTSISGSIDLEAEPQAGGSVTVTSLRGAVDVRLRGTVGVAVRARAGGRVTLAGAATPTTADRWIEARYGARRDRAAVQVESRFGDVSFALMQ